MTMRAAPPAQPREDLAPRVVPLADQVFAYLQPDGGWMLNNMGFVIGSTGVISVDATCTEARTRRYLATIGRHTDRPVRTVVNTHHHADHTFGNHLFAGATIIGHERARTNMLEAGTIAAELPGWEHVDFGEIEIAPPTLTYTDRVTLWSDDLRCDVRYVGRISHTPDDSIVWIPEHRILFSGDLLFNGGTPFVLMGSIRGILETFDDLDALGAATIVPGHGPVGGPDLVDRNRRYLRFVQAAAADAKAEGLTPLAAARRLDLGEWSRLLDPERIVGNLHRAYLELDRDVPLGSPLDLRTVHAEMVVYNGGEALRCRA